MVSGAIIHKSVVKLNNYFNSNYVIAKSNKQILIIKMVKLLTITLLLVALNYSSARPQPPPAKSAAVDPIVSFSQSNDGAGNFQYAYETGSGIKENASGTLKDVKVPKTDASGQVVGEKDGKALVQTGQYSYTAPDGQLITLTYTADENGFQPQGSHLPTPPPAL